MLLKRILLGGYWVKRTNQMQELLVWRTYLKEPKSMLNMDGHGAKKPDCERVG